MPKSISYPQNGRLQDLYPFKNIVLAGGCFDILHYGHITFLKSAKAAGGDLLIALESDENIARQKKTSPTHTQQQRTEILAELTCVDGIILLPSLYSFEDYLYLVEFVQPTIIAATAGDPQLSNKQKQAHLVQAEIKIVTPLISNLSSRLIRATIL
jgi:cytidyltransferase-like protein